MRKTCLLLTLLLTAAVAMAQSLKVSAPSHVAAGEQFRLSYTVDTKDASGFQTGKFPDGVEVLMGPSTSTQSSFQMVNGHMSSSSSITYTYILVIDNEGSYTLPAASITAGGKKINSKPRGRQLLRNIATGTEAETATGTAARAAGSAATTATTAEAAALAGERRWLANIIERALHHRTRLKDKSLRAGADTPHL